MFARARPVRSCSEAGSPGYLGHHPESGWRGNSLQGAKLPFRSNSPRQEVGFWPATQPRPTQMNGGHKKVRVVPGLRSHSV